MNFVHKCACALVVILLAQTHSIDAAATVVNVDEFAVSRNGTPIFDDSFDRNVTLNGGSGTSLPSGTNFSDGTPANYFVQGSFSETTANNGQAHLDTANGRLIAQPVPPNLVPLVSEVAAGPLTGNDPAGPQALTPATSFSAVGLFDLALPSVVLGRYDVYLNSDITTGRNIQIQIRQLDTGPVLRFQWVNRATGENTIIDQVPLTAIELADPQVELGFSHDANSDVVTALYAFGSGNTLASFNGTVTALGSTDSSTDLFTPTIQTAGPGFEAIDPVPEPSSLAILAVGLFGLVAFRPSRKQTGQRHKPLVVS